MKLNDSQQQAVNARDHSIIAAGPGSGKTKTLTSKVSALLSEGVLPEEIAVATFTKDAAKELRDRIVRSNGKTKAAAVTVGTFHSLAMEQLRRSNQLPILVSRPQQQSYIRQVAREFDLTYNEISDAIEYAKAQDADIDTAVGVQFEITRAYQDILKSKGRLDYNDLMRNAVGGMRKGIIAPFAVKHLLLDEYQDVDPIQHEWVKLHAANGSILTAVGDDDQSIYGWRNAMGYKGMDQLRMEYGATLITLEQNYRNAPAIVSCSGGLIKKNRERIEKHTEAISKIAGRVMIQECLHAEHEAICIAQYALDQKVTVLTRTIKYMDQIELILTLMGVPYIRRGGQTIWSQDQYAAYFNLINLVINPSVDGALHFLKYLDIDPQSWTEWAKPQGLPRLGDMVLDWQSYGTEPNGTEFDPVFQLGKSLGVWHNNAERAPGFVIHSTANWLSSLVKGKEWGDRILNIAMAMANLGDDVDIQERVDIFDQQAVMQATASVEDVQCVLMTLHRSKGLEFDRVWIPGVYEGNLPIDLQHTDEERRLLYVGITRAREEAVLSSLKKQPASQYIQELINEGAQTDEELLGAA